MTTNIFGPLYESKALDRANARYASFLSVVAQALSGIDALFQPLWCEAEHRPNLRDGVRVCDALAFAPMTDLIESLTR